MFKKQKKESPDNKRVLVASLLINAAKIDENYTDIEKNIIKRALENIYNISSNQVEELMIHAEKKEEEQNQIIEFTKEIKKHPMEFRLKIVEILWKIVYSDNANDSYESNLIRRICGLLYVSDRDNGIIKTRVQNSSS